MRTVVQRVLNSRVSVSGKNPRSINYGLVLFVGFSSDDSENDIKWSIKKILQMKILSTKNKSGLFCIKETQSEILVISQFTLLASLKKGKNPSWHKAASSENAILLYNHFINMLKRDYMSEKVLQGYFGDNMQVQLTNDGPFTILLDSKNKN